MTEKLAGECFLCGAEVTAVGHDLCQDCLAKLRNGIKSLKEGKMRPWNEVKKELGLE